LISTIISSPSLEADPVLVACHSLILEDDSKAKFSIMKIIKYVRIIDIITYVILKLSTVKSLIFYSRRSQSIYCF